MATQTQNGKAFEYALLCELVNKLHTLTTVRIAHTQPYQTAKDHFDSLKEHEKESFRGTASTAINFLIDSEPKLSNGINEEDILKLTIGSDQAGQAGDVRDVLTVRDLQQWEIGISAKNNHKAVKHSRLSPQIDFGEKWLGIPCSKHYFDEIKPVFDMLDAIREQDTSAKWTSIGNKHQRVYVPILNAFKKELLRLDKEHPHIVTRNLVQYLIGKQDFYKVIKKGNEKVEIQAYNVHGSLNQPFKEIKPKVQVPILKLPSRLIEIVYKKKSETTLLVSFNEGWQMSFRIHSAKSQVESSLKFDINLVKTPCSLFTHHSSVDV